MAPYILKRLLYFLPTLLVISMITFGLSSLVPGDPVTLLMGEEVSPDDTSPDDYALWLKDYRAMASAYNLDKPKFYCSIIPSVYPDTLYKIFPMSNRKRAKSFVHSFGSWASVNSYLQEVERMERKWRKKSPRPPNYTKINSLMNQLNTTTDKEDIQRILQLLTQENSDLAIDDLKSKFAQMATGSRLGLLWPKWVWHGTQNQYHQWLIHLLHGDLGISNVDKRKVSAKIMSALPKTLLLNFFALLVALSFGFLLGVYLSTHENTLMFRFLLSKIYAVLAIPSFWLATLLVVFFTTSDYGAWTNLFPSGGFGYLPKGASIFQKIQIRASHIVLPVLSIAIPIIGVIALQLRRSLVAEMKKTYIKTAILKGISRRRVIWKHGVRNAIFPILTMFSNVLPGLIGGSVAIELIFNISGMGRLLLFSIFSKDWAVVFGILMFSAILTIIGMLLLDILYMRLDPRIRLTKEEFA
ncbi:MAG TPA: ABC transporter permease [Saprospiraceae bacterium]|nr:ABC transporter permease [Saprospiraceae bacterium]